MADDSEINRLGGYKAEQIDKKDYEIRALAEQNQRDISRLDKYMFGNGKPGLEEKLTLQWRVDLEHKVRSRQQAETNIITLITNEEKYRKEHIENVEEAMEKRMDKIEVSVENNGKKLDSLTAKILLAQGGFGVIVFLANHFWK